MDVEKDGNKDKYILFDLKRTFKNDNEMTTI